MCLCSTARLGFAEVLSAAAAIFGFINTQPRQTHSPGPQLLDLCPDLSLLCRFGVIWAPGAGCHPHPCRDPRSLLSLCWAFSSLQALRQGLLCPLLFLDLSAFSSPILAFSPLFIHISTYLSLYIFIQQLRCKSSSAEAARPIWDSTGYWKYFHSFAFPFPCLSQRTQGYPLHVMKSLKG